MPSTRIPLVGGGGRGGIFVYTVSDEDIQQSKFSIESVVLPLPGCYTIVPNEMKGFFTSSYMFTFLFISPCFFASFFLLFLYVIIPRID